jgi:hypothetical protein
MKKKPPQNPVTEIHAQQFAACVVFWADVLGLHDWRVVVSEKRSTRKVMAEVYKFDLEQRSATIRLGTNFGNTEVTERNLSDLALHECLHIFLYELVQFAKENLSEEDISSVEHRIINVLERRLSDASPLGPKG